MAGFTITRFTLISSLKLQVLWNGTPCPLVGSYRIFEGLLHWWTLKMESQWSFETALFPLNLRVIPKDLRLQQRGCEQPRSDILAAASGPLGWSDGCFTFGLIHCLFVYIAILNYGLMDTHKTALCHSVTTHKKLNFPSLSIVIED
jgi:hypothetical protein